MQNLFRPSDVCVGPDGAIYVADWFDTRVGGHQTFDKHMSGTIYRIAPKGFKPQIPEYDFESIKGLIEVLKSPAVNVRALGFYGLKEKGEAAVPLVVNFLKIKMSTSRQELFGYFLNSTSKGIQICKKLLDSPTQSLRLQLSEFLALLIMRLLKYLPKWRKTNQPNMAIRREVRLAARYIPAAQSKDILIEIIKGGMAKTVTYLEAFGYGSDNKTTEIYNAVKASAKWDANMTMVAWRLHPASCC